MRTTESRRQPFIDREKNVAILRPRSHKACDLAATKNDNHREVVDVAARFYKGRKKVTAGSAIGRRLNSVATSLLNLHKRLTATDFDRRSVAKVFLKSTINRRSVVDRFMNTLAVKSP